MLIYQSIQRCEIELIFNNLILSFLGKIYVHCLVGVSRSATCVLAFLMLKRNMLAVEAIKTVRQSRDIHPNEGFLHQLAQLDNYLRRSRL